MMRRTTWIWFVGSLTWTVDGLACLRYPDKHHAILAFALALLFLIAWLFYSRQRP